MSKEIDLAICMPAYNEAPRISGFVSRIFSEFHEVKIRVFVVNDCSTDGTEEVLNNINDPRLVCYTQKENSGHGMSTIKGMELAVNSGAKIVLTCDGDGYVKTGEMLKLYQEFLYGGYDVVEGVRVGRKDPLFRRIVSKFTRLLIFLRTGKTSLDANTPVRCYKAEILKSILLDLQQNSNPVPNLLISSKTRSLKYFFKEYPLKVELESTTGTTWNQKVRVLPSRRFVKFCVNAFKFWLNPKH